VAHIFIAKVTWRAFQKALQSESPKMRQELGFRLASLMLPKASPFGRRYLLRFFANLGV
jgi:hypothetical protein